MIGDSTNISELVFLSEFPNVCFLIVSFLLRQKDYQNHKINFVKIENAKVFLSHFFKE